MLVLTRKPLETITIGDGIRVSILGVRGHTVRIGVEAPKELKIRRGTLEPQQKEGNDG